MLVLILALPTDQVATTGENSGLSGSPTVESAASAPPRPSPTEERTTPTEEAVIIPVGEDPTPEATEPIPTPEAAIPTPGPAPTSTRLQTGAVATGVPDATPTLAPTQAGAGVTVQPTRTPSVVAATPVPLIRLSSPASESVFRADDIVGFAWAWDGQLQGTQYFDLRIWREGSPHRGVAAFTRTSGEFRVSALGAGTYFWSVAVVDNNGATTIAIEAFPPRRIIVE